MKQVTLYIGYCPGSGKQYFGKTTLYHSQKELQENYWGSGSEWVKHYYEWGDPIMSVYWTGPETEVKKIALDFSYKNKIVTSQDWLNQIVETGLDGGAAMLGKKHSSESKQKMKKAHLGVKHSKNRKSNIKKGLDEMSESAKNIRKQKMAEAHKNESAESKKMRYEKMVENTDNQKRSKSQSKAKKGKKIMNNGIISKYISPDEFQKYFDESWVMGKLKK